MRGQSSPVRPGSLDRGLTAAWNTLRPHDTQRAAFGCRSRFVAIPAGRGSGKTELALRKLVLSLAIPKPHPNPQYFFAGPTLAIAAQIAWPRLLSLVPPQWLAATPNNSDYKLTTVFGSTLQLFGINQRESRIEGSQWDGGIIDESCYVVPGAFDSKVMPALTWRKGWCWRIGVPKRTGVGAMEFRKWYEDGLSGGLADRSSFTWKSSEIVPPELLNAARESLDAKDYDEQFNASWVLAGGEIFFAFHETENVKRCQYDESRPIVVGVDFNVNPMAWVCGHRYPNRLEWFDELFIRDTNTAAALDTLWRRYGDNHKGGWEFFGDAAGHARKTSAGGSLTDWAIIHNDERFKRAGRSLYVRRANPAVADRFASCNAMFCNKAGERRMFIDPHCQMLIRDLKMCSYRHGSSEPDRSSGTMLGHISDAMGYAVWRLFPLRIELDRVVSDVKMTR